MPKSINIAPNWEKSARYLLHIIKNSTNLKDKEWAESEVVRMGRIIDTLQAQQTELLEAL
ncbi:MAG: hypothetical protein CL985_00290 [Euryarchaeota archaeon]|nr:hypothetical protein [Euryarchaeota archaeon]|tara:strand:- start:2493 stop:2672 length:180 start_codon:yes stop_codon:yes gene_type:complete